MMLRHQRQGLEVPEKIVDFEAMEGGEKERKEQ